MKDFWEGFFTGIPLGIILTCLAIYLWVEYIISIQ